MSHQSMSPKARSAENGGKQNPAFCATADKVLSNTAIWWP